MNRYKYGFIVVLAAALTSGCATSYKYDGKTYASREAAESAAQSHMNSLLEKVEARADPIVGEGVIYVPDRETVLRYGVDTDNQKSEAASYVSKVMYYGIVNVAKMIEKRRIFRDLKTVESDGSAKLAPSNGVPVVYLEMTSNEAVGWYYVSEKMGRRTVDFDSDIKDGYTRLYTLVEQVEDLAEMEQ